MKRGVHTQVLLFELYSLSIEYTSNNFPLVILGRFLLLWGILGELFCR